MDQILESTVFPLPVACGAYRVFYAEWNETTLNSVESLLWLEIKLFENV